MEVISNRHEIYARISHERHSGRSVGLVPTMGALHAGHISLLERSREICDVSVATIFVNPSQFGPKEDFTRYPRTLEDDLAKLERAGTGFCLRTPIRIRFIHLDIRPTLNHLQLEIDGKENVARGIFAA